MGDGKQIFYKISDILEANRQLNFDISLTPEGVEEFFQNKVLFCEFDSPLVDEIEAALFVTIDGECGFIASKMPLSTYKFFVTAFKSFVVVLPQELQQYLWCRVQRDNISVQKLAERLGFQLDKETDVANYYIYKGGV